MDNVGVGTTASRFNLELGAVGIDTTTLYANGRVQSVGIITANNVFVSGILTATSIDIQDETGDITTGIVTAITELNVGSGGTVFTAINQAGIGSVGIKSTQPTSTLDVQGHTKLKTYSESVGILEYNGSVVNVDLSLSLIHI